MNITNWNTLPDPVELDVPLLNPHYTSKGWDLHGRTNQSGLAVVGYGPKIFDDIEKLEIPVRREKKRDVFLAEFALNDIHVKNETRISYINGVTIKLEERLNLLNKESPEVKLICFVCREYKVFSEFQADHCQPQNSIIDRMKAYWIKLKDPKFLAEQKRNPLFSKMFTFEEGILKINQFFQRAFLHSEDNLWSACQLCNGFRRKSGKNPFEFFKENPFYGDEFLQSLPPINARGILIRAGDRTLAQCAIDWFMQKTEKGILDRMLYSRIKTEVEISFTDKVEKDQKKMRKLLIRLEIANEDSDSSDDEFDEKAYRDAVKQKRSETKNEYHQLKA